MADCTIARETENEALLQGRGRSADTSTMHSGLMDLWNWTVIILFQVILPTLLHPLAALETLFPTCAPFCYRRFLPATDIESLEGKVILVTGGYAGFHCLTS
jgi:hypothetical protein